MNCFEDNAATAKRPYSNGVVPDIIQTRSFSEQQHISNPQNVHDPKKVCKNGRPSLKPHATSN